MSLSVVQVIATALMHRLYGCDIAQASVASDIRGGQSVALRVRSVKRPRDRNQPETLARASMRTGLEM